MTCKTDHDVFVFDGCAYTDKKALRRGADVKPRKAARVPSYDGPPAVVYRVAYPEFEKVRPIDRFFVDPIDVRLATAGWPGATVSVMAVRH